MTFFYDLNKRLATIADKPETKPLNESAATKHESVDEAVRGLYSGDKGVRRPQSQAERDVAAKDIKAARGVTKQRTGSTGGISGTWGHGTAGAVKTGRVGGQEVATSYRSRNVDPKATDYRGNLVTPGRAGKGVAEGSFKEQSVEEGMMDTLKKAGKAIGKAIVGPSDQEALADLQDRMYPDLKKVGRAAMKPAAQPKPMAIKNVKEADIEEGPEVFKLKADAAKKAGEKQFKGPDGKMYPVKEGAKPDYIDLDKDGNRRESMKKAAADRKRSKEQDLDEGWDDMMKDVAKRHGQMKKGEKVQGHKGEIEKTDKGIRHTRRYDDKTGETDTGDDDTPKGEKRRGRPKGTGKAMGAKGPTGKSKLMTREEIEEAIAALEEAGYSVEERKLTKPEMKKREEVVKSMKKSKGDFEKRYGDRGKQVMYATATKVAKKKAEDVEENTVAGNVAPAAAAPKKSKGGFTFGKGIYDSMNRELENMISESMNVSVNMSMDENGQPHKSISVNAEGEAAEQLAQLLSLAGLQGGHGESHSCPVCDQAPCGCSEMVDENAPDWPTNTEVGGEDDPHLQMYADGLNGPKETGQTTTPVVNRDPRRGSFGPPEAKADVNEAADLGMKLYHELKQFKG